MNYTKIIAIVVIVSFFFALLPMNKNVSAAWWNTDFNYYIPITIESDYVGNNLNNCPQLVVINSTMSEIT